MRFCDAVICGGLARCEASPARCQVRGREVAPVVWWCRVRPRLAATRERCEVGP